MGALAYVLSEDAALTVLLHASKHPACTVNGVLLGKPRPAGGWEVAAAVPLFHRSHVMAPCVETALTQAEAAAAQQGLQLVGYYHCDYKYATPAELGPLGRRIADRIADRLPGACALLLDNARLAAFSGAAAAAGAAGAGGGDGVPEPLELLLREPSGGKGGAWRRAAPGGAGGGGGLSLGGGGWGAAQKRFLNLFAAGRHRELSDFDEHLDDVGADFLNDGLLAGSELLARWRPTRDLRFQVQETPFDAGRDFIPGVYLLPLFNTSAATLKALKAKGVKGRPVYAVCSFDVATARPSDPDFAALAAAAPPPAATVARPPGSPPNPSPAPTGGRVALPTAAGAAVSSSAVDLMFKRLELCRSKGFDGAEVSGVEEFNAMGSVPYLGTLANEAHRRGLAIGLGGIVQPLDPFIRYFDFFTYRGCGSVTRCNFFPAKSAAEATLRDGRLLPVWNLEFSDATIAQVCMNRDAYNMTRSIGKDPSLDARRKECPEAVPKP
ncbi:MAG: hypothetical protein J3K34DRAFT_518177 [Monoraphidium minutum]|nr:MAG: hypothetical protein J3K34DRAFT_518177 [Monoraphidium minutum]